jgi:hypothetical protein
MCNCTDNGAGAKEDFSDIEARLASEEFGPTSDECQFLACASGFNVGLRPKTTFVRGAGFQIA